MVFIDCHVNRKYLIGWTNWDRTSGMPESKSGALPLGYTPIRDGGGGRIRTAEP